MLKKMNLRIRITVICVVLLLLCCIGLTTASVVSANRMANIIEATPLQPAAKDEALKDSYFNDNYAFISSMPAATTVLARKNFLDESIIYMIITVLGGGLLIYILVGKTLKPLENLNIQIKNKTVHNLSELIPEPDVNDEVTQLTNSFNQMSTKLNGAFEMQKRFSQSAAHELRTPLAVVKTKINVFHKKEQRTKEEYEKLISTIENQNNRLAALVQELLDLSNMDAMDYNDKILLKPLMERVVNELSSIAQVKNISIETNVDYEIIIGNNNLFYRAIYNLVENAIKYNVQDGYVNILTLVKNNHINIIISDSGIGVNDEYKELIFEPFYRVDKSRSRQMGGAGLGLSLVKNIIEAHDGIVTVGNNKERGSIFTITLPMNHTF